VADWLEAGGPGKIAETPYRRGIENRSRPELRAAFWGSPVNCPEFAWRLYCNSRTRKWSLDK